MRYATPNILEILKTKVKLHLKEGESPNSISFIYQRTFLDQAIYRRKIDLLSTRQNDQKEGESPNSVSFIYQLTFLDQAI